MSDLIDHTDNHQRIPTDAEQEESEARGDWMPDCFSSDGPPPGWGSASMRADDAVREGCSCRFCGKPTERLGQYQLRSGRLMQITGNGPAELDPKVVFDPTGELQARATLE